MTPRIPIIEKHRGVGIHDFQDRDRIERIVKPALDVIYAATDVALLIDYAGDFQNPAEARLFAAAKVRASREIKATGHESRGSVDLERLAASVGGLDSLGWTSAESYCSSFDTGARAPGARVDKRPADQVARLLAARGR